MNIVFFGNTKYSVIVARKINEAFSLKAVVTIPDRQLGRNKILTPSPIKQFAQANNIPVITTGKIDESVIEQIKMLHPDFLVVADYGLILPQKLLDLPKIAPLNIHHSLLPKYRGPSPVPFTILNGEKIAGVTIIIMNNKVDAGDMVAQKEYVLKGDETTESLLTKLNELGGEIIIPVIQQFAKVTPQKQDHSKATFTKRLARNDGYIDISDNIDPIKLDRMIRAYYPWPGVWTKIRIRNQESRIKFLPEQKLQVEGKKPMSIKDFLNGYPKLKDTFKQLL